MNFFKNFFGGKAAEPVDEGPVSAAEIKLVQQSRAKVVPIAETASDLFYGKLFELDPKLKVLFPEDMKAQGQKLMQNGRHGRWWLK